MLDLINRYAHGFVAVPVMSACERRGLFTLLAQAGPLSLDDMASRLGANSGHLRVALRVLESVKWITRTETGAFQLMPAASERAALPATLPDLSRLPIAAAKGAGRGAGPDRTDQVLQPWLDRCRDRWNAEPLMADLLDGVVLVPLLLALRRLSGPCRPGTTVEAAFRRLHPDDRTGVATLFAERAWATPGRSGTVLTDAGRFLMDRIFITGTVASYRPMLQRLDDLIFGDAAGVFGRTRQGHERHVDRTLNVSASGFQHEKYFSDIERAVRAVFDAEPVTDQPRFVMDTGSGDGTLLRRVYETIRDKSRRGKLLDTHPLTMIGVDFNEKARRATARTLAGIPHLVMHGDIGDPGAILQALADHGVDQPGDILHLHSFLDHDRPFQPPRHTRPLPERAVSEGIVSVDRQGRLIPPAVAFASLVEHFDRWRQVIGRHGLMVLEVHSLDPGVAGAFLDESESLHFDAYHGFSNQHLVPADAFLTAAAGAGLFPRRSASLLHPRHFAFTRITLHHLERQPYLVRPPRPDDLAALVALDRACWPPALQCPEPELRRRIESHPGDHFVLELAGELVAAVFTQPIAGTEVLRSARHAGLPALRDPHGHVVQLLGFNVLPAARDGGVADRLMDFVLLWTSCRHGGGKVTGISRCRDFLPGAGSASLEEHIRRRDRSGRLVDPVLAFHESHGARILGIVRDYRPEDAANTGHGVLIEYDLRRGSGTDILEAAAPAVPAFDPPRFAEAPGPDGQAQAAALAAVIEVASRVAGPGRAPTVSPATPFMDMGFDSVELLELRSLLGERFGRKLEPTFLFRHTTALAVAGALADALRPAAVPAPSAAPGDGQGPARTPIAVTGLACRFPGGGGQQGFWDLIASGGDAIRTAPSDRWTWPDYVDLAGEHRGIDRGGFLDAVGEFDAALFRLSPAEAELTDPQQRLLLELARETFEDAGHAPSSAAGTATGVFIGACHFDYRERLERHGGRAAGQWATGTFGSILANRVSYVYDLHGPSLTIDTACSSALAAVHAAVRAIHAGECTQALVGGVNLICGPTNTLSFHKAGMLSRDGLCRTFDAAADGYVRGEGGALVLLKPLDRALADGDHIYGVIAGSALNHGGQAGSLTAPRPQAQRDVLVAAWRDAGISPASLSYIEVHGTGTPLGDPIEVVGLREAYATATGGEPAADRHCGLGSVKTNIGHLEGAAGIAGMLKVLLGLEHDMLPAHRNFQILNPHIDLGEGPFFVQERMTPWPRRTAPDGRPLPRRAGVSSFGFGGVNAHVVIEDHPTPAAASNEGPVLIVLSARSERQLARAAAELATLLATGTPPLLADIAYTLQHGRDAMEERLAVVVSSVAELRGVLERFVTAGAGCRRGRAAAGLPRPAPDGRPMPAGGDELDRLGQAWVTGAASVPLPSRGPSSPRRVPLPTYPFDRQSYWIGGALPKSVAPQPLDLALAADDPLMADHRMAGHGLLPGAVTLALAASAAGGVMTLRDVAWQRPLAGDGRRLALRLGFERDGTTTAFRLVEAEDPDTAIAAGMMEMARAGGAERTTPLDIAAVTSRCTPLDPTSLYQEFARWGLDYGPAFRTLRQVHAGAGEALAELAVGASWPDTTWPDTTWPDTSGRGAESHRAAICMLDGAMQAALVLAARHGDGPMPMMPCFLGAGLFLAGVPDRAIVHVRRLAPQRYALLVADLHGRPCVRLDDLLLRPLPAPAPAAEPPLYLTPQWLADAGPSAVDASERAAGTVLIVHPPDCYGLGQALAAAHGGDDVVRVLLGPTHKAVTAGLREVDEQDTDGFTRVLGDLGARPLKAVYFLGGAGGPAFRTDDTVALEAGVRRTALGLLRLAQAIGRAELAADVPLVLKIVTADALAVVPDDPIDPCRAMLGGMAKTLALEFPSWRVSCIDVSAADLAAPGAAPAFARRILAEPPLAQGRDVAWRAGQRFVRALAPITLPEPAALRPGGVYLVLGGAGGIGEVLCRHLADNGAAGIALVGRSPPGERQQALVAGLERRGTQATYLRADITDRAQVRAAVEAVRRSFGGINGVVHSAIVLRDGAALTMDEAHFRAAADPKLLGAAALHEAIADEPDLDFIVYFSSALSFSGNAGQVNYVAGSAFKDAFAAWQRCRVKCPVRVINWGYWGSVGIVATQAYRRRLDRMGIHPITMAEGLEAFRRVLSGPVSQAAFLRAGPPMLKALGVLADRRLETAPPAPSVAAALPPPAPLPAPAMEAAASFQADVAALGAAGTRLALDALRRMGAFAAGDAPAEPSALEARLGIAPDHTRLFRSLLDLLARDGLIVADAARGVVGPSGAAPPPLDEEDQAGLAGAHPAAAGFVPLLRACMDAYPAVLTGRRAPADVLFPNGSSALVEGVYRGNAAADRCNALVAYAVRSYVDERRRIDPAAKLRVLELGAGTGATTRSVLQALLPSPPGLEYWCTDLSLAFVHRCQAKFGTMAPFSRFSTLDVERDPAAQGFDPGCFDLVLCSNVLHATRDLAVVLEWVKALLKGNGVLVLNELTAPQDYATLCFGLAPGWWAFADTDRRLPGGPLADTGTWRALMGALGLRTAAIWGRDVPGGWQQTVIVAESDGIRAIAPLPAAAAAAGKGAIERLQALLADVLKLPLASIDPDAPLSGYGVDSLMILEINGRLRQVFGRLPAGLLLDHGSVQSLAGYLAAHHPRELAGWVGRENTATPAAAVPPDPAAPAAPRPAAEAAAARRDIAVIGIAGRYPMADSVEEYWEHLRDGRVCTREAPADRWSADEGAAGRRGGFLRDVDRFDALFFGIAPREADALDPQERHVIETVWTLVEDAGYTPRSLTRSAGRVGVFLGVMNGDYEWIGGEAWGRGEKTAARTAFWSCANRISYLFDFRGPSLAVDTACSSSLTALHLACSSLRLGECEAAVAGGVNLILHPKHLTQLAGLNMLSQEGVCRAFGQGADGFVDGEGVGAVLLKPLERAVADGDRIDAVIRGSAVNACGRTGGYMVPSAAGQADCIADALARAGVDPRTVGYVEAHGTGTALGDPIEVEGLAAAFGAAGGPYCAIGSVKPNIGHLESAAGIAGLTKVVMQLRHGWLAPSLHASPCNPEIDFTRTPFRVQAKAEPWLPPSSEPGMAPMPRRAGISSFGAGGANAHLVVEEHIGRTRPALAAAGPMVIVLSAKSQDRLPIMAAQLCRHIAAAAAKGQPLDAAAFRDMAFTLQTGREAMRERLAVVAADAEELADRLIRFTQGESGIEGLHRGTLPAGAGAGAAPAPAPAEAHAAASAFVAGAALDWSGLYDGEPPRRVALPTYPFARARHWIGESERRRRWTAAPTARVPIPGPRAARGRRVAVIGAGPAGLAAAKCLMEDGHDPTIFERTGEIGGMWAFRPGGAGGPYASTRFQTSKYTSLLSDFPPPAEMETFPAVAELNRYFHAYADQFDLRQRLRLRTALTGLHRQGAHWALETTGDGPSPDGLFDAVAVCTGAFWDPFVPDLPGRDGFRGRQLHSAGYCDAGSFAGRRVLVVGNGVSGMDIAAEAAEAGGEVFWSLRKRKMIIPRMFSFVPNDCATTPARRLLAAGQSVNEMLGEWRRSIPDHLDDLARGGLMPDFPLRDCVLHVNDRIARLTADRKVQVVPEVAALTADGCSFVDGTALPFDIVVYCTGFRRPRHPFLGGIGLDALYEGQFHPDLPNVAILGHLPASLSVIPTMELQARWFSAVLTGTVALPDAAGMREAMARDGGCAGRTNGLLPPSDSSIRNIGLAARIGAFPDPATDWPLYWELVNMPPLPPTYRLVGPNRWEGARASIDGMTSKLYVNRNDPRLRPIKVALLARLGEDVLRRLAAEAAITPEECRDALAAAGRPARPFARLPGRAASPAAALANG